MTATQVNFDAKRICRVCLREHSVLYRIYDESLVELGATIVEILNECTGYTVERYDKMPHQICADCLSEAKSAYRFKRQADASYRTLVDMVGRIPSKNKHNHVENSTQTDQCTLYPCEMCDEKFFSSNELRQHRVQDHSNTETGFCEFRCRVCGELFEQLRQLQTHLEHKHQQQSVVAGLQCISCQRLFTRRDHMLRHTRTVHKVDAHKSPKHKKKATQNEMDAAADEEYDDNEELQQELNEIIDPSNDTTAAGVGFEEMEMVLTNDLNEAQADLFIETCWTDDLHKSEDHLDIMADELVEYQSNDTNPISSDDEKSTSDNKDELWLQLESDVADLHAEKTDKMPARSERICTLCGEEFQDYKELCVHFTKRHRHSSKQLFNCTECERKFVRKYSLQRHMKQAHNKQHVNLEVVTWRQSVDHDDNDDNECIDRDGEDFEFNNHSYECNDNEEEEGVWEQQKNELRGDMGEQFNMTESKHDVTVKIKVEPVLTEQVSSNSLEKSCGNQHKRHIVLVKANSEQPKECEAEATQQAKLKSESVTPPKLATTDSKKHKVEIVREYLQTTKKTSSTRTRSKRGQEDNPENRCDQCQRTFSRHCHLLRHKLSHLEQKPHACPHCPKTFARSDHLKAHIQSLHSNKDQKCNICDAAFARAEALERHKLHRHNGAGIDGGPGIGGMLNNVLKLHTCEYCEKKFTSKSYLRKHALLHTDLLYACKNCDETFKLRQELRVHEKTHAAERNFLCCVCGDSFARNDYLRVHMRRHNGEKPYKCKYCGKGFPRATDVKVHERYHTGTKPNLCTQCGKGFHRAYNLTIHMRTHTGERPYKCDQCPKSFTQSNDLKAHIRRHTGERYKCNECDACFLQLYAMRHHAFSVHGTHIESKTGRLQRTGLLDVASTQPQVQTVMITPNRRHQQPHQHQPPQQLQLPQLHKALVQVQPVTSLQTPTITTTTAIPQGMTATPMMAATATTQFGTLDFPVVAHLINDHTAGIGHSTITTATPNSNNTVSGGGAADVK